MEFDYVDGTENSIAHLLTSDEKTIEEYPFEFGLKVIHELKENELYIKWLVENTGEDPMYFTIGGHPAFQVPADNWKNEDVRIDKQENYFLTFEKDKKELEYVLLDPDSGTAKAEEKYKLLLEDGQCLIGTDRFDNDALIFDNMQIEKAGIAFPDGTPYVTLECKGFPNFGIWQAPKAPFICLEPWWGRCDNHGFDGSIDEKPGIIKVEAGEKFDASYKIIIE